jgi:hypothetical protein
MLGSEFDGERATAASMIAKMAKEAKMGVAEFVMQGGPPQIIYRDRIVEKTVYRDREPEDHLRNYRRAKEEFDQGVREKFARREKTRRPNNADDLIAGLRHARAFPEYLTDYEIDFLDDVFKRGYTSYDFSWRQEKVARKIIAKVRSAQGEPLI